MQVETSPREWHSPLRIKELERELFSLRTSLICSFNQLLDLKDLNTGVHSTRLAELGMQVARMLGTDSVQLQNLEIAALLHDIGKIGVPDHILKKPDRLTDAEFREIRKHPEYGWAVLKNLAGLEQASLFILHHHENVDGSGYPAGLKHSEIPLSSRIISVIDAFDAMVSSRPYRTGMPVEEAIRRLRSSSGSQFDPAVVNCFVPLVETKKMEIDK